MDRHVLKKIVIYVLLYGATLGIIFSTFYFNGTQDNSFPVLRAIIIFFASILLLKYFFYMFLSPWNDVAMSLRRRSARRTHSALPPPRVSVIIPAWNEQVGILSTIRSLLRSTYTNLEIIVVNDGSTDNSDAIIRGFIEKYDRERPKKDEGIKIVYHYKENGGKGAALNTAIGLATGGIIVSIDADCIVLERTIENFVKCFADPKVMAAVGNVKIGNTRTIVGVVQYLEFLFSFYFKKADSLFNTIYIIGGAAGAFRREVFDRIGLFSTTNITEDIELSVRIQNAGMKIVYASDAVVYTEGATELRGLMKQRLRWKRGRFETFLQHRHLFFSTQEHHSGLLSWLILPLALFSELQLFLELLFLIFLYVYSFVVSDFSSFLSGMMVVGTMFFVQIFFDDQHVKHPSFYRLAMLAPIGWMLFYLATFVEYSALVQAAWGYYTNQDVKWQRWERTGVADNPRTQHEA